MLYQAAVGLHGGHAGAPPLGGLAVGERCLEGASNGPCSAFCIRNGVQSERLGAMTVHGVFGLFENLIKVKRLDGLDLDLGEEGLCGSHWLLGVS